MLAKTSRAGDVVVLACSGRQRGRERGFRGCPTLELAPETLLTA